MKSFLLKIYRHLPAPARTLAAAMRGLQLRSWRYGPESERLIAEAAEREGWSEAQWQSWREERLARLLHRAATEVPFYRAQWEERRRKGDRASWEILAHWPLLDKESLRQTPRAFIADDCDPRRMYAEHTSGTTGKPLDLWWSRTAVREWYALFERRVRHWHGVSRHEPWAILGGQPVVPADRRRPPFWVWNRPMNQLYLSANHIGSANAASFHAALIEYGVTHLVTYSSSAAALAREFARQGLSGNQLKTVITNAEPLLPWQRAAIREGFGCEARETYGMAEIVAAAGECPHGTLHQWPEAGFIEVLRDDADVPAALGEAGRLISTGLINSDMPLIRYRVGDRLQPMVEPSPCPCGRTLPALGTIEGRTNDLIRTPDGRQVFWLNPVFYGLPVCEAQIVQESPARIVVRYVPTPDFSEATKREIVKRLIARLGEMEIALDRVDSIPRDKNGKFRAVISRLP